MTNDQSDYVEPKTKTINKNYLISEKLRNKAFIPSKLPDDFLRILLDNNQLIVNNDTFLAHNLQYGINPVNVYRPKFTDPSIGRGKLQIDIIEARLAKNVVKFYIII
jgi:hypothetical protein